MRNEFYDDSQLWIVVAILVVLIGVMAIGAGSDISSLQRRVGQLEVQCEHDTGNSR